MLDGVAAIFIGGETFDTAPPVVLQCDGTYDGRTQMKMRVNRSQEKSGSITNGGALIDEARSDCSVK